MSLSSRITSAAGVSAAGLSAVLLVQRIPGTAAEVAVAASVAAASGPALALAAGTNARARDALERQIRFAPAWALAIGAACLRAGTSLLQDVAGAHGVAGIALVHGPAFTVVGMWLCLIAAAIAVAGSVSETLGDDSGIGDRLVLAGAGAQILLITALFSGPQVRSFVDAVPWIVAATLLAAWAWYGRIAARMTAAPWVATGLAAAGLILVVAGGRP